MLLDVENFVGRRHLSIASLDVVVVNITRET